MAVMLVVLHLYECDEGSQGQKKNLRALVPPIIDIFKDSTHKCTVNHPRLYEQFFLPVHIVVHIRIEGARA